MRSFQGPVATSTFLLSLLVNHSILSPVLVVFTNNQEKKIGGRLKYQLAPEKKKETTRIRVQFCRNEGNKSLCCNLFCFLHSFSMTQKIFLSILLCLQLPFLAIRLTQLFIVV